MDRRHWRRLARDFDRKVTDTPRNDAAGVIRAALRAAAGRRRDRVLVDVGCGPATLIRRHAPWFRRAVGVDFAEPVLELARRRCRGRANAEFRCADAAAAGRVLSRTADVLACMNVATSASPAKRDAIGRALAAVARPGATLLLVVPSLESAAFVHEAARARGLRAPKPTRAGLVARAGDPQKAWSESEVAAALRRWGFSPRALRRVRVPWSDEGLDAARFRGLPGPWDWLAVARRQGSATSKSPPPSGTSRSRVPSRLRSRSSTRSR